MLEKHLYQAIDRIKSESQAVAAEEEAAMTLLDEVYAVQQTYLEIIAPLHRVEASFGISLLIYSGSFAICSIKETMYCSTKAIGDVVPECS